ncbi:hypothetical protein HBN76_17070 [Pseudomonas sp. WS 5013]|uniref:hypothetical protein n=1 Tax=Pseudomonas sp. WS 5013 TaxID=2717475 RepID=UPI0014755B13|nr:hypothetical protein [Pseudomonas sp. WS 5013]NMY43034.1 hypothetical protein [Pseudomonas sp. WS 5013]
MPPLRQLAKIALILLFKLAILWLIFPYLIVSHVLFLGSTPSALVFEWPPFLYAGAFLITCCCLLAWHQRDWASAAIGILTVATAGVIFMHEPMAFGRGIEWGLAALSLPSAISFLHRNRVTEPLLVLPALFVLACLFIFLLYPPMFLFWADVKTSYSLRLDSLGDVIIANLWMLLLVLPSSILYWLGKHGYAPWLNRMQALLQRRSA